MCLVTRIVIPEKNFSACNNLISLLLNKLKKLMTFLDFFLSETLLRFIVIVTGLLAFLFFAPIKHAAGNTISKLGSSRSLIVMSLVIRK